MANIDEINARRAKRREEHDQARAAQETIDLEAIDALEAEGGTPLHTMTSNDFKSGVPCRVAFRVPTSAEYKRYCDTVGKSASKGDHPERRKNQETLGEACMVYPAKDTEARTALLAAFPGVLLSLAIEAAKVAELRSEDEGKS